MHSELPVCDHVTAEMYTALRYGHVLSLFDNEVGVMIGDDLCSCKVAFSCIVKPQAGDYVACINNPAGGCYIIAVLERHDSKNTTLEFPSDVTISSGSGSINLVAGESVGIASVKNVNVMTDTCSVKSRQTVANLESVTVSGKNVNAAFNTVQFISKTITTMAGQLLQKVKDYIRHSECSDHVKSAQMVRKVDGLYSLDSTHTVMISKKDTKIDGERIHMG